MKKNFWTDSYPEGVRAEVSCEHKTLTDFFDNAFGKFATQEFSTNMGVTYTYEQIDTISKNIAAWIQTIGLPKGSTIGIMMPNVNQYLPIVIGVIRAGMVLTSINPLYTPRELKHQLLDSEARAIFILDPFCTTLEKVINARNQAVQANGVENQQQAENQLTKALGGIFALAESYPDLKANTNYLNLQDQLSSLESDIEKSRRYYNGTVREKNILIDSFPSNIIANMFHFTKSPFFELDNESERQTPEVKF